MPEIRKGFYQPFRIAMSRTHPSILSFTHGNPQTVIAARYVSSMTPERMGKSDWGMIEGQ
jgi:hypothetical protein